MEIDWREEQSVPTEGVELEVKPAYCLSNPTICRLALLLNVINIAKGLCTLCGKAVTYTTRNQSKTLHNRKLVFRLLLSFP